MTAKIIPTTPPPQTPQAPQAPQAPQSIQPGSIIAGQLTMLDEARRHYACTNRADKTKVLAATATVGVFTILYYLTGS